MFSARPKMPLRQALRKYWPFLLGISAFHVLMVFVPAVSNNWPLVQVLFFVAVLPAMWPSLFGSAPYSFWVVATLYWFFGYILLVVFAVLLYTVMGWEMPT